MYSKTFTIRNIIYHDHSPEVVLGSTSAYLEIKESSVPIPLLFSDYFRLFETGQRPHYEVIDYLLEVVLILSTNCSTCPTGIKCNQCHTSFIIITQALSTWFDCFWSLN